MNILVIVGSLRSSSINKSVYETLLSVAPQGTTLTMADFSNVPLFNGDLEASAFPASVTMLKEQIRASDGVIVITPEYNRSIPGVLKNVIDWTSRPYGDSAWNNKAIAVTGATGGSIGTAAAQQHLKQVMVYLNANQMCQPEMYLGGIGGAGKAIENGVITDSGTKEQISNYLSAFISHIQK